MRVPGLLVAVFMLGFGMDAAVAQQPRLALPDPSAPVVLSAETGFPPGSFDPDRHFGLMRPHPQEKEVDGDNVCYQLRTYFVERESRSSDVTHYAGYSSCQAALRFRLKRTAPLMFPPSD
jgi:hypothetical protein